MSAYFKIITFARNSKIESFSGLSRHRRPAA